MSFRVEPATTDLCGCADMATPTSGVASVEGAVKGGRSPAKRTLYCARNASKLKGLGLVAVFSRPGLEPVRRRGLPRPRGRGQGWGRPKGSAQASAPFHTKRHKPGTDDWLRHGAHALRTVCRQCRLLPHRRHHPQAVRPVQACRPRHRRVAPQRRYRSLASVSSAVQGCAPCRLVGSEGCRRDRQNDPQPSYP